MTIVDLEPQDILAAWTRGDIDAAYVWLPVARRAEEDRQGPDHQPRAGHRRQAHPRPRASSPPLRQGPPRGRRRLAQGRGPGARPRSHDDPDAAAKPVGAAAQHQPGRGRAPSSTQGVFLKPADLAVAGVAGHRRQGRQARRQPGQRRRVPQVASRRSTPCPTSPTLQKAIYVKGLPDAVSPDTDTERFPSNATPAPSSPYGMSSTPTAAAGARHRDGSRPGRPDRSRPGSSWSSSGASGCGKSTLLRLIAGLRAAHRRATVARCRRAPRARPRRRAGLPAAPALPVAHGRRQRRPGAEVRGRAPAERAERTAELLERVGLHDVADRRIWQISGGQQQRVAIARALAVRQPAAAARRAVRRARRAHPGAAAGGPAPGQRRDRPTTSVFVTHSVDEAVFLGSRMVVLSAAAGPGRPGHPDRPAAHRHRAPTSCAGCRNTPRCAPRSVRRYATRPAEPFAYDRPAEPLPYDREAR